MGLEIYTLFTCGGLGVFDDLSEYGTGAWHLYYVEIKFYFVFIINI